MGVTRLLLLGQFYTIKIQFYVLLCTRLYFQHIFLWHNFQWRFWNRIRRNLHAVPTVKNAPRKLPSLPEVNLNFGNKQMAKRKSGLNLYVCTGNLFYLARKRKCLEKNFYFMTTTTALTTVRTYWIKIRSICSVLVSKGGLISETLSLWLQKGAKSILWAVFT